MLKRPESKTETLTFPDPNQDEPLVLTLKNRLSPLDKWKAEEIMNRIRTRYVTGNWVDEKGNFEEEPEPFIGLYGEGVLVLNNPAIWNASMLEVLQPEVKMTAESFLQHSEYYPVATMNIEQAIVERSTTDPKALKPSSEATESS